MSEMGQKRRYAGAPSRSAHLGKADIMLLDHLVAEVPKRTIVRDSQLHQLGAGGTGAFRKAGKASHRPAKRDNSGNRSATPSLGRTVAAKV